MAKRPSSVIIHGFVSSGLGRGQGMTQMDWVREQIVNKLGFDPHPGTFNLILRDGVAIQRYEGIKKWPYIEITPPNDQHCPGKCYETIVGGKVWGAIVMPQIPEYPPDKVEIVAPVNIREALKVADGDVVTIEVINPESREVKLKAHAHSV